jgi:hypothetical protein
MIYDTHARALDAPIFVRVRVIDGVTRIQATGCNEIVIVPEGQEVLFEISTNMNHDAPIRIRAARTEASRRLS